MTNTEAKCEYIYSPCSFVEKEIYNFLSFYKVLDNLEGKVQQLLLHLPPYYSPLPQREKVEKYSVVFVYFCLLIKRVMKRPKSCLKKVKAIEYRRKYTEYRLKST